MNLISIKEYRKITKDTKSTDHLILRRISYLESFCHNIIKSELKKLIELKSRRYDKIRY